MGKGDKRSRRGKIRMGSYGNSRPRKASKFRFVPKQKAKPVFVEVKETIAPIEAAAPISTAPVESVEVTAAIPKAAKTKKVSVKKTIVKKAIVKKTTVKKAAPATKKAKKK